MEKSPLQVSDFLAILNQSLEVSFTNVAVVGEVSEYRVSQGKWVNFKLKDDEGVLDCFASVWQIRTPLEDGMKVVAIGTPKVSPRWGKFSLTLQTVAPVGVGSIKRSFDILVAKLKAEGLFEESRKRSIPEIPEYVGIISSKEAAGYSDFIRIVNERWGGLRIDTAHVQVQGLSAPEQIIRAIRYFNESANPPEVLVIIRGGGSQDDLATFNDEPLVRAVASSRIPTLVGIGHEKDVSLVDLVADVRAATPTHAAHLLIPERLEIIRRQRIQLQRATELMERKVKDSYEYVKSSRFLAFNSINQQLLRQADRHRLLRQSLDAYNPRLILRRGYALVRLAEGRALASSVKIGDMLQIETTSQYIEAEVKNVGQQKDED